MPSGWDSSYYPLFPGLGLGQRFKGGKGATLSRRLEPDAVIPVGEYGCFDKNTANKMFLDLEHEAGVQHVYGRAFHGFRRRMVDILVDLGATPQQIQAAGAWTSLRTPLEIYRRKVNEKDQRSSAKLLEGRTLKAVDAVPPPQAPDPGPPGPTGEVGEGDADPPPDSPPAGPGGGAVEAEEDEAEIQD